MRRWWPAGRVLADPRGAAERMNISPSVGAVGTTLGNRPGRDDDHPADVADGARGATPTYESSISVCWTAENSNHEAFGRSFCKRRASLCPSSETVYTTRGGRSRDTVRVTMPILDRSRRMAARVEVLTPFKCVRRSTNRLAPTLVRRLNTETTYRRPSSPVSLFAGHRQRRL